jgi:hypothetical protein
MRQKTREKGGGCELGPTPSPHESPPLQNAREERIFIITQGNNPFSRVGRKESVKKKHKKHHTGVLDKTLSNTG